MVRKQLVLNAIAVGLFIFLAAHLAIGNKEIEAMKRQLPPSITGFSPQRGMPGDVVTITGRNFRAKSRYNSKYIIKVDGIAAEVVKSDSKNQIQIRIPQDASTGLISVEEAYGKSISSSPEEFEVIPGPLHLHHRQMEAKH